MWFGNEDCSYGVERSSTYTMKHAIDSETLALLPHLPGVYLMRGGAEEVLYVGKAKVLAHRVRSYFQAGARLSVKTSALLSRTTHIETMVTQSEMEALVLENNLIKKYRPKYNVVLRDDKNYPMLRLSTHEAYPRLSLVRRMENDGALYFGPYVPAGNLYELLHLLHRLFPVPNCSIVIDGTAPRPCVEFEIGRCLAPCTGYQSEASYRKMIQQVILFLRGQNKTLMVKLRKEMAAASLALRFEEAASLRDRIGRIEGALERQRVTSTRMKDQDVLGVVRAQKAMEEWATLQVLFVRGGRVTGQKAFHFTDIAGLSDNELCASFLQQFYEKNCIIPKEILLPAMPDEQAVLVNWLSRLAGTQVRLIVPARGENAALIQLACENAKMSLDTRLHQLKNDPDHRLSVLKQLQEMLQLATLPRFIEGYDISNIMGTNAVGSMVVFKDGLPNKTLYRRFRIKTVEGVNDFAMMGEVLGRRMTHRDELPLPNLMLIDGGPGQLQFAMDAVAPFCQPGTHQTIDIIGLAKAKGDEGERVYRSPSSEPIPLTRGHQTTYLLQNIRDEAHRFAVTYHRKRRDVNLYLSQLDQVKGIGKQRKVALLKHFGSLAKVRTATMEELEVAPLMNRKIAEACYQALHDGSLT